ncbi:hypothetical protein CBS101457_006230 [Exobasidium rhododendri]|nr:hypothetical protein CBS101457_006230 [Exobasidium rhododendri]
MSRDSPDLVNTKPGKGAPQNAVAVFIAHFHVRRGNEVLWSKGDADLGGVEWKVLPSGSHAISKDLVYFETGTAPNGNHRIGVAAFRNRSLNQAERSSVAGDEDEDQRGARILAVGAIFDCGSMATPWSQLAATLPHCLQLEALANALSADPTRKDLLEAWLDSHLLKEGALSITSRRNLKGNDLLYAYDPLFQLPAISNALGPLLPSILKRLLLPSFRFLIYIPGGVPTYRAASIAFALGELTYSACQSRQSGDQCPATGASSDQHGLVIRGLLGLHDISTLQEEAKIRSSHGERPMSWIAWTTDKILLEKCRLYDAVLDLSPITETGNDSPDFSMSPTALPRLLSTQQTQTKDGRINFELKKQSWTTREFAIFRNLDEEASFGAVPRRGRRRSSAATTQGPASSESTQSQLISRKHSRGQQSTFLAFLRFWLSNLWILPHHWRLNLRSSFGYVPLSIRGDGGVRASIMLLPDDNDDDEDDDDCNSDDSDVESLEAQHGEVVESGSQRRSSFTSDLSRTRRVTTEEEALDPDATEVDPFLAACGATQAPGLRRRSIPLPISGSSLHADTPAARQTEINRSPVQSTITINAISAGKPHQSQEEEIEKVTIDGVRLSYSIFKTWSMWIRELVMGLQDLLEEKLIRERVTEMGEEGDRGDCRDATLLPAQDKPIQLTMTEMSGLDMSVHVQVDVDLTMYLASTVTDRDIAFQTTWWPLNIL